MTRICFVCLGNICRSPTAEGVMRALIREAGVDSEIEIDSAGTGGWHAGEAPDKRSTLAAKKRGVHLEGKARQVKPSDFERFDYLVAMDEQNLLDLQALAPNDAARAKLHLLRDFDPAGPKGLGVPDPYYGGERGFDEVFDICRAACLGLLEHLRAHVGR